MILLLGMLLVVVQSLFQCGLSPERPSNISDSKALRLLVLGLALAQKAAYDERIPAAPVLSPSVWQGGCAQTVVDHRVDQSHQERDFDPNLRVIRPWL